VDLWALGVMLYELVTGQHPFSVSGEVATYSKIASYGTKSFQNLPFGDDVSAKAKALINKLVVPTPEARLGVSGGFHALKKHTFFEYVDWLLLPSAESPLGPLAQAAAEDLHKDGVSAVLVDTFSAPYSGSGWDANLKL
jgi:serine/threonine protein kinase